MAKRTPTTAELDLEARQKEDYVSPLRIDGNGGAITEKQDTYAVKGNDTSAYVGVSPEYMTYANDTEKPLAAKSGVEAEAEIAFREGAPTLVKAPEAPTSGEQTLGGGTSVETVTTALSGSGLQAELAAPVEDDDEDEDDEEQAPATPPVTTATAPTPPK